LLGLVRQLRRSQTDQGHDAAKPESSRYSASRINGLGIAVHFAVFDIGVVYDAHKNRVGNLTLLEKPINIIAGNDFFTRKQEE